MSSYSSKAIQKKQQAGTLPVQGGIIFLLFNTTDYIMAYKNSLSFLAISLKGFAIVQIVAASNTFKRKVFVFQKDTLCLSKTGRSAAQDLNPMGWS